jgi:RNA polymerase sigma factor (sigma-70 family)
MIVNNDLKTIKECKNYKTFLELFQAIARKLTQGYECLMALGWKKILPMLRRQNPTVDEVILEDSLLEAITVFICGLAAIEPFKKYDWDNVNIGLLRTICKNKIINNTSRDQNQDFGRTNKVEDWEEYSSRIKDFKSYCYDTTFYNAENVIKYREFFLKTLSDREREIYILYYEEGKTVSEICELLGISPANVYRVLKSIEIKIEEFKEKIRQGEL